MAGITRAESRWCFLFLRCSHDGHLLSARVPFEAAETQERCVLRFGAWRAGGWSAAVQALSSGRTRRTGVVGEACRGLIGGDATVSEVAALVGVSRATLHRVTVGVLGVTPSALRLGARDQRLREALATHGSVLEACFAAGFGSASAAYAQSARAHGAPPGVLRGHAALELRVLTGDSNLGAMVAAKSEAGLCLLEFLEEGDDAHARVQARFPEARVEAAKGSDRDLLARAIAAVDTAGRSQALPIDVRGTAFQQQVWAALQTLRAGERVSYSELAARIGRPSAARAVARAVGENPIAVRAPGHRVVDKNGGLVGYRWGMARKARLLAREDGED